MDNAFFACFLISYIYKPIKAEANGKQILLRGARDSISQNFIACNLTSTAEKQYEINLFIYLFIYLCICLFYFILFYKLQSLWGLFPVAL